jgi:CDP-glucose 4,6-dehydratase
MEDMAMNRNFWRGKNVFVSGHTGFKGGWLALWLAHMGARVYGYALAPPTEPNLFTVADLSSRLNRTIIADIRDADKLTTAMKEADPDVVFHLAAQPLVRCSYETPVDTYAVNVMGTVNLLEAVRQMDNAGAVVNVTTDKCYENREWVWPYRENEAMGGNDPYASSKACSELVTAAYRASFLEPAGIHVATARAGNVIGGGDWAKDRLIPDALRALDARKPLVIRSPKAVRPWQHVLEPLAGYLLLAQNLYDHGAQFSEAWNFGPEQADAKSVEWVINFLLQDIPHAAWHIDTSVQPHEANTLKLDNAKARTKLGWLPRWHLAEALKRTMAWHQDWCQGQDMAGICLEQIQAYEKVGHDRSV